MRTIKKNPETGFADDFKMIADVTVNSKAEVQLEIDNIAKWAKDHDMPLSIEKSSVMHCGKKQPYHEYTLGHFVIKSVDSMMDLGILRTADVSYSNHCQAIAAKARTADAIRHALRSRDRNLMWAAFQSYVLPITMYCSPLWNSTLKKDINALEKIQRRFTKYIRGLHEQSYADRLKSLYIPTLEDRRFCTNMLYIFKVLHHKIDCSLANLGLTLQQSKTRGNNLNFVQRRATSKLCASLFPHRAASSWNKLPLNVLNVKSIHSFKTTCLQILT